MENKEKVLYVVDTNVTPRDGSELFEQFPEAKGAFLTCFVKAQDALDAGNKVKEALENDHYTVTGIEEILLEDSYDVNELETEIKDIISEAKSDEGSEVYYGPFYCYVDDNDV